nr:MAG TPA: hypothetical protein [Caudoviricetes sp.]
MGISARKISEKSFENYLTATQRLITMLVQHK